MYEGTKRRVQSPVKKWYPRQPTTTRGSLRGTIIRVPRQEHIKEKRQFLVKDSLQETEYWTYRLTEEL